ncbi:uncharacterized protein LOC110858009 isoform X2 [Folsomia candida]|uniref:uncharacterized protein LOC110858009 isoform X2 n=1 Tax=Folsomia candida TaxID=158441 RepID=UPI000B90962A|nr:uncharacterized protein LOC110858009 isoform X2 [Folsomia candida]
MKKKHYIVIILDVNSIPRESPRYENNDIETEHDGRVDDDDDQVPTTPGREFNKSSAIPYKYGMIKSIKDTVLTLLAKEALQYHTETFDFSQVFWSIKLYNSSYEINSKTGRSFQPLGMESIEAFEKQLESFLDMGSQSAKKSNPDINQIQFLSTSLKSVLGDLPWPEPSSGLDGRTGSENRNVIHAMFRVPKGEIEVQHFVPNWTPAAGSKSIMNELLPKAFCRKMKEHQIQLHFLDLEPAFQSGDVSGANFQDSENSKPMVKIATFLGGTVAQFTEISRGVPIGMPSYADLLKLLIAENTHHSASDGLNISRTRTLQDEAQKTIRKLQGSMNGSVVNRVSPVTADDADGDSVTRSHGIRIPTPSYALANHLRRSFPDMLIQHRIPTNADDRRWIEHTRVSNVRRFSDERDQLSSRTNNRMSVPLLHDQIPKKRKYEFEEDMESEEGYSPLDIENWCMGKAAVEKEKHQPLRRPINKDIRGPSSSFNQKRLKHPVVTKYRSPKITQPQKRIRRERTEQQEIMAPPIRHYRHMTNNSAIASAKQHRYSDPTSTTSYTSRIVEHNDSSTFLRTRGHAMVDEGLKKKLSTTKSKQKAVPDEDTSFSPKINFWQENERILSSYKNRFQMLMQQQRVNARDEDPIEDLAVKVKWCVEMVIGEEDCCLPSLAQVVVTTVGAKLVELKVRDLRDLMEKILFVPYTELNLEVIRHMHTDNEDAVFRKCFLQVFINFEMVWTVPTKNMATLEEQFIEDVSKILGLVRVYRNNPPIEKFVNDVLVPLYRPTHGRLLREITSALNIRQSNMLNTSFDSPRSGGSGCRDDVSVSSFSSSMCGPDDSTSQHPNDTSFSQQSHSQHMNQSQHSIRTSLRSASFHANNPKRALMLPIAKLPAKPKNFQKSQSQSTQSGSLRPTTRSPKPKKVRRNLFDVQASRDPKDMKMLLNLATSNTSSFSRSPSLFKSPMSKHTSCSPRSPGRPSPFFAAARARAAKGKGRSSRRRLIMDPEDDEEHPTNLFDESMLCPESPFTPKSHSVAAPERKPNSIKSVVRESPEVAKSATRTVTTTSRSLGSRRIDSVSFYSSGNESLKARAWERSGAKLMAARIRDSVDLSQSLSVNDLELDSNGTDGTDKQDENKIADGSPVPCSSKSLMNFLPCLDSRVLAVENNESSSIQALIHGEMKSSPNDILLNSTGVNLPLAPKSPGLDTPSKRVKFSLELVQTPSPTTPARSNYGTPVTPKSILKDAASTPTPNVAI